jgi:hypothetical protein
MFAPIGVARQPAKAPVEDAWGEQRVLLNPLFAIHFSRRLARVEAGLHDGAVGELLDRHPIYARRLPKAKISLSDDQFAFIALAVTGLNLAEIAAALVLDRDALEPLMEPLETNELIRRVRVSKSATSLQRFHANQIAAEEPCGPLAVLLGSLANGSHVALSTSDGGAVTADELHSAVRLLADFLDRRGLTPGRRLWIVDSRHPLAVVLSLAGLARGLDVALGRGAGRLSEDLVVGGAEIDAPAGTTRIAFEAEEGAESIVAVLAQPGSVDQFEILPDGRLTIALTSGQVAFQAGMLADAAMSLSAAILPLEPLDDIAAFPDLLACLVAFGSGRSVMLRV